jgi:hypothetical protein
MSYGRRLVAQRRSCILCPPPATTTAQSAAADERLIRDLEERDRIAVLQRDCAPLDELWSPRLMVTTPANTVVPDSAAVRALKRSGQGNYARFERHIEQLRIEGSVAVVMGYEIVEPMAPSPLAG